jgi:hypothetical protein
MEETASHASLRLRAISVPLRFFIATILLWCRAVAADFYEAPSGAAPSHLVPVPPGAGDPYETLIHEHLIARWGSGGFGTMLVLPSFKPEYCVSIYPDEPEEQRYVAVVARVSESLWNWSRRKLRNEPVNAVQVTHKSRPVSRPLAAALQRVWVLALQRTRYPVAVPPDIEDGVVYRFSVFVTGLGDLHGQCHSPQGGLPRDLADFGRALCDFVETDDPSSGATEEQLIERLKALELKIVGA